MSQRSTNPQSGATTVFIMPMHLLTIFLVLFWLQRHFFRNLGSLLLYAFVGTTVSTFIIGYVLVCVVLRVCVGVKVLLRVCVDRVNVLLRVCLVQYVLLMVLRGYVLVLRYWCCSGAKGIIMYCMLRVFGLSPSLFCDPFAGVWCTATPSVVLSQQAPLWVTWLGTRSQRNSLSPSFPPCSLALSSLPLILVSKRPLYYIIQTPWLSRPLDYPDTCFAVTFDTCWHMLHAHI